VVEPVVEPPSPVPTGEARCSECQRREGRVGAKPARLAPLVIRSHVRPVRNPGSM
jgi:hypothetical protein